MGEIIKSLVGSDHIRVRVTVDEDEALNLMGRLKGISLFSKDLSLNDAKVVEKGVNGATKYFEIPKNMRHHTKKISGNIKIQRIDTGTEVIFIYVCDKKDENLSQN